MLWCVGLLSAIAAVILRAAHSDLRHAQLDLALAQAQVSADGAVRLAVLKALAADKGPVRDGGAQTEGEVSVAVQDETALVDINTASPAVLAALLRQAGQPSDGAGRLADAIVALRGPPPGSAPFFSTRDLLRVPGLSPDLLRRLLPLITVYSGTDGLRIAARATVGGVTAWRVADIRLLRGPTTGYRILTWMTEAPR